MAYNDPEKQRANRAAYYAAHMEEEKARRVAWRTTHREEQKASSAAYRAAHPEKVNARQAAYMRAYRAAHPEIARLNNARRRAQKRGLPATLTGAEWESIQAAYQYKCAYCGKPPLKGKKLTQDHVLAEIKGGGYIRENIVPACAPCNSRKHNKPPTKPVKLVLV